MKTSWFQLFAELMTKKPKRVSRWMRGPTAFETEMRRPYRLARVRTGTKSEPRTRLICERMRSFFLSALVALSHCIFDETQEFNPSCRVILALLLLHHPAGQGQGLQVDLGVAQTLEEAV